MTTLVARILIAALAVTQIPLAGEVFAQENVATSTENTEENQAVVTAEPEPWFTTEGISGRVDIGDFVVGPGRAELTARPGETIETTIFVTNRISDDREFLLEVEDIVGSDDGSSMVALDAGEKSPRGLVDFIVFPEDKFQLKLGQRAQIPVTIVVPENASPGGYFGAVLVSTVRAAQPGQEFAPRSPLIARVASLIFLTVEGEVRQDGKVLEIDTINNSGPWYESGPIEFGVLYENNGTVHLNPYGEISIRNILGEEVGYLQLEPWFVLPSALRLREFTWDREFLFGRYTAVANVNRGYDDVIDTVEVSFWVLPWRMVGTIFVILFIIIFAVRAFFRTFEFKRKSD